MLVLSRQKNESIVVGDDVVITIMDVRGDNVRLGITAPKNINIARVELIDKSHPNYVAATQPFRLKDKKC
jgi:carbon storage regulator